MTVKELLDKVAEGTFIRIYCYHDCVDAGFVNDITMVDCTVLVIAADDADRIDIIVEE